MFFPLHPPSNLFLFLNGFSGGFPPLAGNRQGYISNTVFAQPKTQTRLHYKQLNPFCRNTNVHVLHEELKSTTLQCDAFPTHPPPPRCCASTHRINLSVLQGKRSDCWFCDVKGLSAMPTRAAKSLFLSSPIQGFNLLCLVLFFPKVRRVFFLEQSCFRSVLFQRR